MSDHAALAAVRLPQRMPMPSAAAACLLLFFVSTALAVTETRLGGDALAFGEIATLDSVLESGQDRFVTLILEQESPSKRSQRLLAKIRRSVDESPAGRRTIGDKRKHSLRGDLEERFSQATIRIGDAIAAVQGNEGLAELLEKSLAVAPAAPKDGITGREMPGGTSAESAEVVDVMTGTLSNDDPGFAIGETLGARRERDPSVDLQTSAPLVAVDAAVPAAAIRRVVNQHREELRSCYETELRRASGLRTHIALRWFVGADGGVQNASVRASDPRWPPLERCVLERVRAWRFPAPPDGTAVEVNYPVAFRPVEK
ncbi:MAG: AgmX/PglI C-terminal domain-containing protein [Myxococcota bacterium]